VLLGLPFIFAPNGLEMRPELRRGLWAMAVILSYMHALICGAFLLAGEYDLRTMPYLEGLPALRWHLWQGKFLSGLLLVFTQIALLMGLAAVGRAFEDGAQAAWTLFGLACAGLFGLAWGLLFSALGRSTMNMILLSLAGQFAAAGVCL